MRFYALTPFVCLLLACPGQAQQVALETDDQRTLYAIGLGVAQGMKTLGLSAEELDFVEAGLRDGVLGNEARVDMAEVAQQVREFAAARSQQQASAEADLGRAWLAEIASGEGVVKTDSGLLYQETTAGEGESPTSSDRVSVHYHGTFRDGTVFDSSVERGQPATFPLEGIIPCWQEGLQLMKPGGKATLYCPPDIAYGERGAPPRIPPGASLKFDVELIEIAQ